jgi:hypothetical protein
MTHGQEKSDLFIVAPLLEFLLVLGGHGAPPRDFTNLSQMDRDRKGA